MSFNIDPYISIGRSVVIAAGSSITTLGFVSYMDPATLIDGFNHLWTSAKEASIGLGILGPAFAAGWAAWRTRNLNKAQAAGQIPGVTVIVDHTAAPDLRQAASDPNQPDIVKSTPDIIKATQASINATAQ